MKRITMELKRILLNPPPGILAAPQINHENFTKLYATIDGPDGTPYENGRFHFEIKIVGQYPFEAPKVKCKTRIYHCNFAANGAICLDVLKDNWSAAMTLKQILLSIQSLIGDANPDDPLDERIAIMYKTNRELHDATARDYTSRYAQYICKFGCDDHTQNIIQRYRQRKMDIKQQQNCSNDNNNYNGEKEKEKETEKEKKNRTDSTITDDLYS